MAQRSSLRSISAHLPPQLWPSSSVQYQGANYQQSNCKHHGDISPDHRRASAILVSTLLDRSIPRRQWLATYSTGRDKARSSPKRIKVQITPHTMDQQVSTNSIAVISYITKSLARASLAMELSCRTNVHLINLVLIGVMQL